MELGNKFSESSVSHFIIIGEWNGTRHSELESEISFGNIEQDLSLILQSL